MSTRKRPSRRKPQPGKTAHALEVTRNAGLEAGSNAHYLDPEYYDATYEDRAEDINYYVEQATALADDVLEYGCGNGRIALPLARAGLTVTGVDRSPDMIRSLKRVAAEQPAAIRQRLSWRRGDMRRVRFKRRFPLVLCTFNTFLHLYNRRDVEQFCARVHAHLKRGGRFIVDVSVPEPEELARDPSRSFRSPRFKHPATGQWIRYSERFDYDSASQIMTIAMQFVPRDDPGNAWMTPLSHRQFFPQELEALLHYNKLPVVDVHADFDEGASLSGARILAYHCRRR